MRSKELLQMKFAYCKVLNIHKDIKKGDKGYLSY